MQAIDEIKSTSLRDEARALIKHLMHEHIQMYGQVVEKLLPREICERCPDLAERIYIEIMTAGLDDIVTRLTTQHTLRPDEPTSEYEARILDLIEKELKR